MSLIDINKPLSTLQSSAINKSHQHQEKNFWESRELNPVLLGEKLWSPTVNRIFVFQIIYLNSYSAFILVFNLDSKISPLVHKLKHRNHNFASIPPQQFMMKSFSATKLWFSRFCERVAWMKMEEVFRAMWWRKVCVLCPQQKPF